MENIVRRKVHFSQRCIRHLYDMRLCIAHRSLPTLACSRIGAFEAFFTILKIQTNNFFIII